MTTKLYAAIATTGRSVLLQRTLTSLSNCRFPDNFVETIVVENGLKKNSDTERIVQEFAGSAKTRYLYLSTPNKSAALNHALAAIDEGLVFFTDDDVRFQPDILNAYSLAAQDVESGVFFGGPMGIDYESEPPAWIKDYLPLSARGWHLDGETRKVAWSEMSAFFGCNWAAFALDLKDIGGYDNKIGPGSSSGATGQETNMQRRLCEVGLESVYIHNAKVWHYVPEDRCSPRWALRRKYRLGVSDGLRAEPQQLNFLGYPRWMLRKLIQEQAVSALKRSFSRDIQVRFDAYCELFHHWGVIRGVRLVSRDL